MSTSAPSRAAVRHPLTWVPSLYLAMGIPNVTVAVVAAIMYKNLGMETTKIALYTSQMYLPWVLKPFWAPLMEPIKTKRFWVLAMQFVIAGLLGAVALSLPLPSHVAVTLAFFWIVGFASATQDIAADALYMTSLSDKEQSRYAGVQGMFWNLGAVVTSGALVWITGALHERLELPWLTSWLIIISTIALLMLGLGLWHLRFLPHDHRICPAPKMATAFEWRTFLEVWRAFFRKPGIWLMLAVVFFYRFGEGFVEKLGPLFLLEERAQGGLGLSNQALGSINGTLGTIGFIAGALLGGAIAEKLTLKRSLVILAIALNVPHLSYFILSHWVPGNLTAIATLVTVEKFGYGIGSVGHMLYMMQQVAPGSYLMAHYAFATGIMAMCRWFTGSISGYVYQALGRDYRSFFTFVLIASVVPVIFAWLAPFAQRSGATEDASRESPTESLSTRKISA